MTNNNNNNRQQDLSSSTTSASSDDMDLGEEEQDGLSAPDFSSQFLKSTNWKPINIYDEQQIGKHLLNEQQLKHHQQQQQYYLTEQQQQLHQHLNQHHQQQQQQKLNEQHQQQKLNDHQQKQKQSNHLDSNPAAQQQTLNFNPSTTIPQKQSTKKSSDQNLHTSSHSPQLNRYPNQHPTPTEHHPTATLTTSAAEATWGSNSRTSVQPTPNSRAKPHSSVPTTHRSRMASSDDNNTPTVIQRPRRVSDGSINGGVRKDMLLQRMAEALQSERAKALVFQKELQNAEREIDELANTLDEQRRVHHKAIVSLKKDIKLLKKERENLVEALEAAEGVEQEEAERYLTLLDPAAQAVMVDDDEIDDHNDHQRQIKPHQHSLPPPQPIFDDYDLSDYKTTIRAQMQDRSALRAERINAELLKINPGSSSDPNVVDSEKETAEQTRGGVGQQRQDRTRESTNRVRRKLSKTRPSSRDGSGGVGVSLFWRRSISGNREMNDEKLSSTPGTIYRTSDRRKISAGNHTSISHEDDNPGYYDSGPLQRSPRRSASNGKIGKLFRKVFPTYKDDKDHQNQVTTDQEDMNYSEMSTTLERNSNKNIDRNLVANRRRRTVLD